MNDEKVKEYWNDLLHLGNQIQEEDEKSLKKNVELFSEYLSSYDRQYCYNATFLPLFVDDFVKFLKCFCRKFPVVLVLLSAVEGIAGAKMIIDRYWKCENGFVYSICEVPDYDQVCSEILKVECDLLVQEKRFLFYKEIRISENVQQNIEDAINLEKALKVFIKNTKEGK